MSSERSLDSAAPIATSYEPIACDDPLRGPMDAVSGLVSRPPPFDASSLTTLSLPDLGDFIDSNPWLQQTHILESAGYHKWRLVLHRFLVLKLRTPRQETLWLRFDRRPQTGLVFLLGSGITIANDQAVISSDHERIIGRATWESERVYAYPPTLGELKTYLPVIQKESALYRLWPENCWMFCRLIEDLLSWGDNCVLQRGQVKHTELARNVRSRVLDGVRHIYNMADPFTIPDFLAVVVGTYGLWRLPAQLSAVESAATQWHVCEDFDSSLGRSLADRLAGALGALGHHASSQLSLTLPAIFQQTLLLYRRLEKRHPGRYASRIAGCLAWLFKAYTGPYSETPLLETWPNVQEAVSIKRRLCLENPLDHGHARDLSAYLYMYSVATRDDPAHSQEERKIRALTLLHEAKDAAARMSSILNNRTTTKSVTFLRQTSIPSQSLRQKNPHTERWAEYNTFGTLVQHVNVRDFDSLQQAQVDPEIQLFVPFNYARRLVASTEYDEARRCIEDIIASFRQLPAKSRLQLPEFFVRCLLLHSKLCLLSGTPRARLESYTEAISLLRRCEPGLFFNVARDLSTHANDLFVGGFLEDARSSHADAAQLCCEKAGDSDKSNHVDSATLWFIFHEYGTLLTELGEAQTSCAVRQQCADLLRAQYGRDPSIWDVLIKSLRSLAVSLLAVGRLHDAKLAYEELLGVTREVVGNARDRSDWMTKIVMQAEYLAGFADLLRRTGDSGLAYDLFVEAIDPVDERIGLETSPSSRELLSEWVEQLKALRDQTGRDRAGPAILGTVELHHNGPPEAEEYKEADVWDFE